MIATNILVVPLFASESTRYCIDVRKFGPIVATEHARTFIFDQ